MSKTRRRWIFLMLVPILAGAGSVSAQDDPITDAEGGIMVQLLNSGRTQDVYPDDFVIEAIKVIEKLSKPDLLHHLGNLASTTRVSPSSKKRIEDFLHQEMKDSNPSIRIRAVSAASFLAKERSVPWLLQSLEDTDQKVRIAALAELFVYASPSDFQAIDNALQKRRTMPGVDENDATIRYGEKGMKILRQLEEGADDYGRSGVWHRFVSLGR